MDFIIVLKGAQLGAGNDTHSKTLACGAGRGNTIYRIVIGQRDGGEPALLGGFDYLLWRERTIRCCGVRVQIDECRPCRARTRAHCS